MQYGSYCSFSIFYITQKVLNLSLSKRACVHCMVVCLLLNEKMMSLSFHKYSFPKYFPYIDAGPYHTPYREVLAAPDWLIWQFCQNPEGPRVSVARHRNCRIAHHGPRGDDRAGENLKCQGRFSLPVRA